MKTSKLIAAAILGATASQATDAFAQQGQSVDMAAAEAKASATVRRMKPDEKTILTHGILALPIIPGTVLAPDAVYGAGYIGGIPRLGVPPLTETDASLGVAWVGGIRKDGATALPSALAQASSWSPELVRAGGAMIGSEARAKGFNVLLAGGVNLMRDPRNGRTFEYFSEDPLLSGVLGGAAINGIQSNNIISTIKHLALNGQETGRKYVDVKISDSAAYESDLLAFELGIEIGQPGSVMCAYNRVRGKQACDSDWLLNTVLKKNWGFKGFVMSDWGAVPGVEAAMNGLDQQSGEQMDKAVFFGDVLKKKAASSPAWAKRLDDMNKRILTAIYAAGLDQNPPKAGGNIDFERNALVAEQIAKDGIVLLKNNADLLPLAKTAKSIAVIGGLADVGVVAGSGSSLVHGQKGPSATRSTGGQGLFASLMTETYHASSPLAAIKAMAKQATVTFRDGRYIADAVTKAKQSEVAIVFATEWRGEGLDQPDLSLPYGQNALIEAVAKANPNTIVVLETGGPVMMPWLGSVGAVIQAWYPGARGGEAIASVLFGDTNPSGRLPITFPASLDQLPRPLLDGSDWVDPNVLGEPVGGKDQLYADYDIEGSDVGYRWFSRKGHKSLFPFGYGLSYTSFSATGLEMKDLTATFSIANTGKRAGADVGQLYLVSRAGKKMQRLVGFKRVTLEPGASEKVTVTIDPRLIADWQGGRWVVPQGDYAFALGRNAEELSSPVTVRFSKKILK